MGEGGLTIVCPSASEVHLMCQQIDFDVIVNCQTVYLKLRSYKTKCAINRIQWWNSATRLSVLSWCATIRIQWWNCVHKHQLLHAFPGLLHPYCKYPSTNFHIHVSNERVLQINFQPQGLRLLKMDAVVDAVVSYKLFGY